MSDLRPARALGLVLLLLPLACKTTSAPDWGRPLPEGSPALLPLDPDESAPDLAPEWERRAEILPALDQSIYWLRRPVAKRYFPMEGVEHERAWLSAERFRELLSDSSDADSFAAAVAEEFTWSKSAGWDGRGGGVLFTGYCTPILAGSLEPGGAYRYPLHALPPDLVKGKEGEILGWRTSVGVVPYPSRRVIEASGMLANKGLELVWLADPLDAYIAHVNGSAFVRLENGEIHRFGYAGKNGRAYHSLGRALVEAGEIKKDEMSLTEIRAWGRRSDPEHVQSYLDRNDSYVFFQPIEGNPHGSLDVEVSAGRSIATDKTLFPRGGLVFVDTHVPTSEGATRTFRQLLLDQDTGGAIRTAGRADLYFGVGEEAESVAGGMQAQGQLYYLFLSPERADELAASGRYRAPTGEPARPRPIPASARIEP